MCWLAVSNELSYRVNTAKDLGCLPISSFSFEVSWDENLTDNKWGSFIYSNSSLSSCGVSDCLPPWPQLGRRKAVSTCYIGELCQAREPSSFLGAWWIASSNWLRMIWITKRDESHLIAKVWRQPIGQMHLRLSHETSSQWTGSAISL